MCGLCTKLMSLQEEMGRPWWKKSRFSFVTNLPSSVVCADKVFSPRTSFLIKFLKFLDERAADRPTTDPRPTADPKIPGLKSLWKKRGGVKTFLLSFGHFFDLSLSDDWDLRFTIAHHIYGNIVFKFKMKSGGNKTLLQGAINHFICAFVLTWHQRGIIVILSQGLD